MSKRRKTSLDLSQDSSSPSSVKSRRKYTRLSPKSSSSSSASKRQRLVETKNEDDADGLSKTSRFTKGKIVRVRINNIYTHSDVEFEPGAGLNLILGPNGSGKSTIACAIHVGLGGKLRSMMRSEKMSDFIRHGCETAFVELELFEAFGKRRNATIRVNLSHKSATTYRINGRSSSLKEVRSLANSLNIKVDNKCQFLGQECVVSFARMKRDELLLEMLRVVDPKLCDMLQELIELQKRKNHKEEVIEDRQQRLENLKEKQANAEKFVRNKKQQEEYLEKAEILQKKRLWVEYTDAHAITIKQKEKVDTLKKEVADCQKQAKPFHKIIKDTEKQEAKASRLFEKYEEQRKGFERQSRTIENRLNKLSDQTFQKQQEVKRIHKEKTTREMRIAKMREVVSEKEIALSLVVPEEKINQLRSGYQAEKRQLQKSCDELNWKSQEYANMLTDHKRRLRAVQHQLKKLDDERVRKYNQAFGDKRATRSEEQLYKWVVRQRESGVFQDRVYGPIILECDVFDETHASYLDAQIGFNVKFGYVVSNGEDWRLINTQARSFQAQITTMEVRQDENPRRHFDMKYLQQRGVVDYLDKTVKCERKVLSALYLYSSLHGAVFTLDNRINPDAVLQQNREDGRGCNLLYTPSCRHNVRFSRYPPYARSGGVSDVKRARFFSVTGQNSEQQEEFKKQIDEIERNVADTQAQKKEVDQQQRPFRKKITAVEAKLEELKIHTKKRRSIRNSLRNAQQRLADLENLPEFDKEIKKLEKKILGENKQRIAKIMEAKETLFQVSELSHKSSVAMLDKRRATQITGHARSALNNIEYKLTNLEGELRTASEHLKGYRRRSSQLKAHAEREAPWAENKAKFEEFKETSVAEIDHAVVLFQTKANALYFDEHAIQEYYKRAELIEIAEKEQEEQKQIQDIWKSKIESTMITWLPRVKQIVTDVAAKYEQYFEDIGCSGTVKFKEDEDFSKYELQIFVRFRKDTDLKLLSSTAQSGGERSVSTMLFLLALQGVTNTPFRLVDEINQGMDADNERMILSQIIQNTSSPDSPQYFLVTPKLLPNLEYGENITILFVFNGTWMLSQKKWDMAGFINSASQRNSHSQSQSQEEDAS